MVDFMNETMWEMRVYNELILVMRGEKEVQFSHSGTFVLGNCNGLPLIRYLDSVNSCELYWPKTPITLNSGSVIRTWEDFDRDTYFEWSLYSISRGPVKDVADLTSALTTIMTTSVAYAEEKRAEGLEKARRKRKKRGYDTNKMKTKSKIHDAK